MLEVRYSVGSGATPASSSKSNGSIPSRALVTPILLLENSDEFSSRSASPLFCSYQRCFQFHPFSFLLRIIHSPRFIILASILGIFTLFSFAVIIRAKLRHVRSRWKATANGINVAALRSPASNGDASAYAPLRAPSLFGSLQHAPCSFRLLLSLSRTRIFLFVPLVPRSPPQPPLLLRVLTLT